MSKLLVKFPSRNRPEKFKKALDDYTSKISGKHEVRFVISMDADDETMNNDEIKKYLNELISSGIDLVYHYGESKTKVQACNADMDGETFDVLLLISDDMALNTDNYDEVIFRDFSGAFPEFDGGIKYHDGLRGGGDLLMTLPCIGWKFYESCGYIYHPDYTSVFCDNDMTQHLLALKKYAMSQQCIARHEWTSEPFDELHARNENAEMYAIDKQVFVRRMNENFGV
tara:strand:+ start:15308 stop:15988 length:681 start_codon:yes stop_codon:yes gene_type:complete